MSDKKRAQQILERWYVGITREERTHDNMPPLFNVIAEELFMAGAEFDIAYDTMREAAKRMYPAPEAVKYVFGKKSRLSQGMDIRQFTKNWQESIDKAALAAFYEYYEIAGIDRTKKPTKQVRHNPISEAPAAGISTEDALNEEDFWNGVKSVSKSKPWLFNHEDSNK